MRALLSSLVLAALLVFSGVAKADTLFRFNATVDGLFSTSGTLQGTSNGNGSYSITSISAPGITQLVSSGSSAFFNNDDLLFPGSSSRPLDVYGLDFLALINGSTYEINLYTNNGYNPPSGIVTYADYIDPVAGYVSTTGSFSASAITPEPSSLALLGTGLLGIAAQVRRRYSAA